VSASTWRDATSVQFAGLAGVLPGFGPSDPCDWGLGVEVKGAKRPHWTGPSNSPATYGHFGQSGSFLWVDPVVGVLCCGLADRPFGVWASRAWPALAEGVLAEVGADAPADRPPHVTGGHV
jgi:CubicO group peptidase (beta-lactamase class C family)